jgi:hypothetical protein
MQGGLEWVAEVRGGNGSEESSKLGPSPKEQGLT